MKVYRCVKPRHEATAFDGEGARLAGGRWSSKGQPVVYGSESAALAALEVLVNLQDGVALGSYVMVEVELPDGQLPELNLAGLPKDWRDAPWPPALQAIGDQAMASGVLGLRVPSAVLDGWNVLLNPAHPVVQGLRVARCPRQMDGRLQTKA